MDITADMLAGLPPTEQKQFRDYCNATVRKRLSQRLLSRANAERILESGKKEGEIK